MEIGGMATDRSDAGLVPVLDGHNDVLLRLIQAGSHDGSSFFERGDKGHIDLPRAREGGFAGGFFAMFVPPDISAEVDAFVVGTLPPPVDPTYALGVTMSMAALLFRLEAWSQGQVKV